MKSSSSDSKKSVSENNRSCLDSLLQVFLNMRDLVRSTGGCGRVFHGVYGVQRIRNYSARRAPTPSLVSHNGDGGG